MSKQNAQIRFHHAITDLIIAAQKEFSRLTLSWCTFNWTETGHPSPPNIYKGHWGVMDQDLSIVNAPTISNNLGVF